MLKYTIHILILSLLHIPSLSAQSYRTAAGVRFGGGVGMSVEQKIMEKTTIEGVITQQSLKSFESPHKLSAMVKRHHYIKGRALNGYWGLGGNQIREASKEREYGVAGVIGIEGTLFYLNTAIDYRPTLLISDVNGTNYLNKDNLSGQFSVSFRYVIVHAPYSKKKKNSNTKEYDFPPYKPSWT